MFHSRSSLMLILALGTISVGCNSLKVRLQSSRLESPETNGKGRINVKAGVGTDHLMQITSDASDRPTPDFTSPKHLESASLHIMGGYGLLENLDVAVKTGTLLVDNAPLLVQGKFQFLGDNAKEANEGNFSTAATVAAGWGSQAEEGDQDGTFGRGGHDWNAEAAVTAFDAAIIFGYRFNDKFLLFGGPYISRNWVKTDILHEESDNGDDPETEFNLKNMNDTRGFNLGFQYHFSKTFNVMIEANHYTFEWDHAGFHGLTSFNYGALVELTFPD